MSIFEMMMMNEEIAQLAAQKSSIADMHAAALRGGMITLEESGYQKVLAGMTSLEEVMRVTVASI